MPWPTLDPGELRHAITLHAQSIVQGDAGAEESYVQIASAHAKIETTRAIDQSKDGETTGQLSLKVTIWYQPGLDKSMRVRTGDAEYRIRDIENPQNLNVILILHCTSL